jgi:hypothetical protein
MMRRMIVHVVSWIMIADDDDDDDDDVDVHVHIRQEKRTMPSSLKRTWKEGKRLFVSKP